MSEYEKIALGKDVMGLDISPQFQTYSGVEIVNDDGESSLVGNKTGRVITIPGITASQAQTILSALQSAGFQYQPYTASGALLNPAAELGDGVTVNGVYSGIYKMSRSYSPLMSADIEAPYDEEIDHEYPYEPKQDRIYKRELAESKAQISLTQTQIAAEVTRASAAEGNLSSRITATADAITSEVARAQNAESNLSSTITQTSTSIRADVVAKSGGTSSSFGWNLTDSSWTLTSNNQTVFKATSSGVEVKGKITATSGYIGDSSNGFRITSTAIYNGRNSLNDSTHNGVYIGTDGISLGKGAFKVTDTGAVTASNLKITGGSISIGDNFRVTSAGDVTANNMTLNGTLNVGGQYITADALRQGAQSAYNNAGTWSGTSQYVNNNGGYWSGGAGWGYDFGNATKPSGTGPSLFKCTTLQCSYAFVGGKSATWQSKSFYDRDGNRVNMYYLGQY